MSNQYEKVIAKKKESIIKLIGFNYKVASGDYYKTGRKLKENSNQVVAAASFLHYL